MIRRSRRHRRPEVDCREVGRILQGYLDGEVEADLAAKIATHLDACRECGLEYETYRHIKSSLAARRPRVDTATVDRLRAFGRAITDGEPPAQSRSR